MKKAIAVLVCAICVASCGSSDISTVKNGVLDFNKTLTVGQALDNWKNCKGSEWSEFTSDNGVKVVQFACDEKIEEYMAALRSVLPKGDKSASALPSSDLKTFQFTLNKDGTFQLYNVSDLTKWADGTENEQNQAAVEQLQSAYENKMEYDMSVVDGLQKGNSDSEAAAEMLAVAFEFGKVTGKTTTKSIDESSQESTPGAVSAEQPASTPGAAASEKTALTTPANAGPSAGKAPDRKIQDNGTQTGRSVAGTGAICEAGANGIPAPGSAYQGGIYLCREHVEGGYWNDWYASRTDLHKLHVESDGKTSEFSGDLTIDCSTGAYSWADAKEFDEALASDKDIAGIVPLQVVTNARHYLCKD